MTAALEGGEWSAPRPGRTLPSEKTRYRFYRRLGESQGRSGRAENLVPTGIRSGDCPARSQSLYRLSYPHHNRGTIHFRNYGINLPSARLQHSRKPHIRVNTDIGNPESRTRYVIADFI